MRNKYENPKQTEDYYYNGYVHQEFENKPAIAKFVSFLTGLRDEKNLKDGFTWHEEYKDTVDLKPNPYTYDPQILDFVFEQNIPQVIEKQTGYTDLVLGDIAIRKVFPGSVYMGWHRDTYRYTNSKGVGRTPPLQKLIFYPNLDSASKLQLEVLSGSHIRFFRSKILDKLQIFLSRKDKIFSSNTKYLLFNSALYHSVPESQDPKGALRVFLIFCHVNQLDLFKGREGLHKAYLDRLKA